LRNTEPWATQVTAVEIKDIMLPDNMQRAMAKEAEAERERRAKIVAAEEEYQAAKKLGEAADIITQHPVALQLRTLQTMAEISVEKSSTHHVPCAIHEHGQGCHIIRVATGGPNGYASLWTETQASFDTSDQTSDPKDDGR
jgi:SPFH domain/Band 7 family protein